MDELVLQWLHEARVMSAQIDSTITLDLDLGLDFDLEDPDRGGRIILALQGVIAASIELHGDETSVPAAPADLVGAEILHAEPTAGGADVLMEANASRGHQFSTLRVSYRELVVLTSRGEILDHEEFDRRMTVAAGSGLTP